MLAKNYPVFLFGVCALALYLPVCAFVFWRYFPRLPRSSRWLVIAMLVAQLLVIFLSLAVESAGDGEIYVWSLEREFSIPSAVASAQLALVSGAALLGAWRADGRRYRLYLGALGLVFLFLALDEYYDFVRPYYNEQGFAIPWEYWYGAIGLCVALATYIATRRVDQKRRFWLVCLLAGLAISGGGALVVEQFRFPEVCQAVGMWNAGKCWTFALEETLEFLGVWLALIATLGLHAQAAPKSGPADKWGLCLLPFAWIALIPAPAEFVVLAMPGICLAELAALDVFSRYIAPRIRRVLRWLIIGFLLLWLALAHLPQPLRFLEYHLSPQEGAIAFHSGLKLRVIGVNRGESAVALGFYVQPGSLNEYRGGGFSLHLVDQASGASIGSRDVSASENEKVPYNEFRDHRYILKQWMQVDIPPDAPRNRALWLALTAWKVIGGDFVSQSIDASDYRLLAPHQAALAEFVLPAAGADSPAVPIATFDHGIALESVAMPAAVPLGAPLQITFHWRSDQDISRDHSQFLHLQHVESGAWRVFDQPPLGARLPTRLWYKGMSEAETWELTLPSDMALGAYDVYTGLYALADLERLPAYAADGAPLENAVVPLGPLAVESR